MNEVLTVKGTEPLLKASDVAQILNVSRAFAYRLMQQGEIRTVSIGRVRRVRSSDLVSFIEQNVQHTPEDWDLSQVS